MGCGGGELGWGWGVGEREGGSSSTQAGVQPGEKGTRGADYSWLSRGGF